MREALLCYSPFLAAGSVAALQPVIPVVLLSRNA